MVANNIFKKSGLTFSCAESITGGRIQAYFTSMSGCSEYFHGGICSYSLISKVEVLGCDKILAEQTNCIDQEIANQMAAGCQTLFSTDVAISTTGYVESYEFDGVTHKPIAFISVKINGLTYGKSVEPCGDTREQRLGHVADEAIVFVQGLLEK